MQSLQWYAARLRTMSPAEIAWRCKLALRTRLDGCFPLRMGIGHTLREAREAQVQPRSDRPVLSAVPAGAWAAGVGDAQLQRWRARLAMRADAIATGRLSFFDLTDVDLGTPADTQRDHRHGIRGCLRPAPAIDYRVFSDVGDCKYVWEPNRHHQLVVLARAWRATLEARFARCVAAQWRDWLNQNPYGWGVNWRSGLEIGIRLINWVWAYDFIRDAAEVPPELEAELRQAIWVHVASIVREYSRYSSAGNHLIGEASAVFVATSYFADRRQFDRWRSESQAILEEEIEHQFYADGGGREQALGYLLFVLQFLLVAEHSGRIGGCAFSSRFRNHITRICEFISTLQAGGEHLPLFGDADDGYVLDLGGGPPSARALLQLAGASCSGSHLCAGRDPTEELYWFAGPATAARYRDSCREAEAALCARALPDSGYYLLQSGRSGAADAVSVVFDCGALGMPPLSGHGHADALAVTLRIAGRDVLIDPGTYDYYSAPEWRDYFRSTRAHCTVEVDGQDQSVSAGRFLWRRAARARCVRWAPSPNGGCVSGEHDGYARLADPVVHRRTLELDAPRGQLWIQDQLDARRLHRITLHFHFAPHCRVEARGFNSLRVDFGPGTCDVEFDSRLHLRLLRGLEQPIAGWHSTGYHRKSLATTVAAGGTFRGTTTLVTRFRIALRGSPPTEVAGIVPCLTTSRSFNGEDGCRG